MSFLNPTDVIRKIAIPKGSIVADFGFGSGVFLENLSKQIGDRGHVYAIDIQEDIVKKVSDEFLEKSIVNTEFLNADLEKENSTGIADNSVDFILISSLLFQVENKEGVLKEAIRILRPTGRILFIEWKESFLGIGPENDRVFPEDEAINLFKKLPVNMERRIDSGLYHYGLVYRKI